MQDTECWLQVSVINSRHSVFSIGCFPSHQQLLVSLTSDNLSYVVEFLVSAVLSRIYAPPRPSPRPFSLIAHGGNLLYFLAFRAVFSHFSLSFSGAGTGSVTSQPQTPNLEYQRISLSLTFLQPVWLGWPYQETMLPAVYLPIELTEIQKPSNWNKVAIPLKHAHVVAPWFSINIAGCKHYACYILSFVFNKCVL